VTSASPDGTLIQAARESLLLAARDLLAANRATEAGYLRVAEILLTEVEGRTREAKLLLDAAGGTRLVPVRTATGVDWVEEGAPVVEIVAEASRAVDALARTDRTRAYSTRTAARR